MRLAYPLLALLSLSCLSGCSMCQNCSDYLYATYGGKWQRADMVNGRVGSVFDPAEVVMAPAHYAPVDPSQPPANLPEPLDYEGADPAPNLPDDVNPPAPAPVDPTNPGPADPGLDAVPSPEIQPVDPMNIPPANIPPAVPEADPEPRTPLPSGEPDLGLPDIPAAPPAPAIPEPDSSPFRGSLNDAFNGN